jgi:thioredoxin 1
MPKPVYINGREELIRKITENYDNKIVFMFTAKWCGPCKSIKNILEGKWSNNYKDVGIIYIDIDNKKNVDIVDEFGIESIPTFIVNKIVDGNLTKLHTLCGADIKLLEELLD